MTTTQRDDQWRHWLREHARAFVISGEPLWAEMLTVLADSGGPEDTGPITLTSQSDRARVPMAGPSDDVYEAAARAYDRAVNDTLRNPPGYVLGDAARVRLVEMAHFRAAVDAGFAAGVAAGRAQAAEAIRDALTIEANKPISAKRGEVTAFRRAAGIAIIAGGEPRG